MKKVIVLGAALAFLNSVSAEQVESQAAAPISDEQATETEDVHSEQAASKALQIHLGPVPRPEAAGADDANRNNRNDQRIGVHRSVPSEYAGELSERLNWAVNEDGQYTAAVTLTADGAVSLRAQVDVDLPVGGSLQVFDGAGHARGPAYTRADLNVPTWLPSADGDTLTVQISLPSEIAVAALSFTITKVAHRYRRIVPQSSHDELECSTHQNLACATDQDIVDAGRKTARISFEKAGFSYDCSGTLLASVLAHENDTPSPYFLTAHHCIPNASVASTAEAHWFSHYAGCRSTFVDSRFTTTYGGADWLAGNSEQDASLLRLTNRHRLPGGLIYAGWSSREVPVHSEVFSVHYPKYGHAHYSVGRFDRLVTTYIGRDPETQFLLQDGLRVTWRTGATEGGSSGAGLFRDEYLIGILSGGDPDDRCQGGEATFGSFRDFYPQIKRWLSPDPRPLRISHLPLLTPASVWPTVRGIVRVVNTTGDFGTVTVYPIDDTGARFEPLELELEPRQARQFNSVTMEDVTGDGVGSWRLELSSNIHIRVQAFMRFPDNNLAPMHDVIPLYVNDDNGYWYHANKFFPAKHATHVSVLRLINPTARSLRIDLVSLPDRGGDYSELSRERSVWLRLGPHQTEWLTSEQLEDGVSGLRGRLGPLMQGHHLFIRAPQPLWAMNLMVNPTGRVFNISTAEVPLLEAEKLEALSE